jgi:hypothetical protein
MRLEWEEVRMVKPMKDDEREVRIRMEIIVDSYSGAEQAMSW